GGPGRLRLARTSIAGAEAAGSCTGPRAVETSRASTRQGSPRDQARFDSEELSEAPRAHRAAGERVAPSPDPLADRRGGSQEEGRRGGQAARLHPYRGRGLQRTPRDLLKRRTTVPGR